MKKILSLIFALSILMSFSTVKAEGNVQEANALTMPGWTISGKNVEIKRVYNTQRNSWEAKICNPDGVKNINMLSFEFPEGVILAGREYVVSAYIKMESTVNSGFLFFGSKWDVKYSNTYIPNNKNGGIASFTATSPSRVQFGFDSTTAGNMYIDDIMVTDKTTGESVELYNSDFESVISCTKIENVEFADGRLTWSLSESVVGNGINVYMRKLDGSKELLNENPVNVEDCSLKIDIQSEDSYYLDIYTCYGVDEDESTLISIPMIGDTDFGEYKLFKGENEINDIETGELTVKIPFVNHKVEDGFGFEVIVLVKEGITTVNMENKPFTAEITADFVEYSVDIAVDEVTDNTNIEVYVWDGIESMNVLRDVSIF